MNYVKQAFAMTDENKEIGLKIYESAVAELVQKDYRHVSNDAHVELSSIFGEKWLLIKGKGLHLLDHPELYAEANVAFNYANCLHAKADKFIHLKMKAIFPQIFKLFSIYLSIPVTSATAERSFSCLRRLKNWLRSSMGQDCLNALAILNIESDFISSLDLQLVIDILALCKNRRISFK
jgi:hypothetical protein